MSRFSQRFRAGSARVSLVLSAVLATAAVGAAGGAGYFSGQTIPILASASPEQSIEGTRISFSVTVDSVPAQGGAIQIHTSHPSIVASPSGSWPYQHTFAPGSSTSATINFSASSAQSTSVTMGACETGVDATNTANWRVSATTTVGGP